MDIINSNCKDCLLVIKLVLIIIIIIIVFINQYIKFAWNYKNKVYSLFYVNYLHQ